MEPAHSGFEFRDVAPRVQAHGIREEDAEGGDTEAALAVSEVGRRLKNQSSKGAHAAQGVLRKGTSLTQSGEASA